MDHHAVNDEALDTLFRVARTQNKWQDKPVSTAMLMAVYDLLRWGPTSANCSPARIVFCTTDDAKQRLAKFCSPGNRPKVLTTPKTANNSNDEANPDQQPKLFP